MKTIFENWLRFLNENEEKDKRFYCNLKDFKKGIQDWDENKGKNYIDIAQTELDMWLASPINNKSSKYDPQGITLCSVAKYWSAIYSPLAFARKVLSKKQGGTGKYYSVRGNKNPAWSAAFIQYCMRASNDTSWERIQGKGQHLSGYGIGNHAWYWAGAYHNTLLLQNPDKSVRDQILDDDWIYIPLEKLHATFTRPTKEKFRLMKGYKNKKPIYKSYKTPESAHPYLGRNKDGKILSHINFIASDINYSQVRGDIILIVASSTRAKGIKTGRFHGDFITDGGKRIGGNVSKAGGRVGSSDSEVCAILTKDAQAKKDIINFLGFNKTEDPEELINPDPEEMEIPYYDEMTDDARIHPKIKIDGADDDEQYVYDTMNKYYR